MVRKVLVTGANKGLGFEVCKKLLEIPDMYVIVGSRDQGRGEEALKALAELPGSEGRLELTLIDVGDQDSIKKAADAYGAKHGPNSLYCLVNNAGLSSRSPGKEVWAVNAGGPIFCTDAFLPYMVEDGRVLNVSSVAALMFWKNLSEEVQQKHTSGTREDLDKIYNFVLNTDDMSLFEKEGLGDWSKEGNYYSLSKSLLNMHAALLAKQYPKMKCNAVEPGVVETDMTKPMFERMGNRNPFGGFGYNTVQTDEGVKCYLNAIIGDVGSGHLYSCDSKRTHFGTLRKPFVDPEYDGP